MEHWQPLKEHLLRVAGLAREFGSPLELSGEAWNAGLLHDLGKYAERFQRRLQDHSIHGINHWAAGAACARTTNSWSVAFSIDGHHTGIPALNENSAGRPLRETVEKFLDPALRPELTGQCHESLQDLVARSQADGLSLPQLTPDKTSDRFVQALRTRMLFSCLVDADFLDTERHFQPEQSKARTVPTLDAGAALQILLTALHAKPQSGPVNQLRRRLLEDCLAAAKMPPGLLTLTAPTGSGKTLSSLAFALQHIQVQNAVLAASDPKRLRRIIVVIPFTSIIEQTARVYRELFEPFFGPQFVLEHHSAVAPREQPDEWGRDAEEERLRLARLAAENWAAPLVVTTNAQFFESLFSNRPSDCRKLHNIARSVVLFDEVQTLPAGLVPSLLSGVRLLVRDYGVTAVFMTATQPAFSSLGEVLPYGWQPAAITTNEAGLAEALRRVEIHLPGADEILSWVEVAGRLAAEPQALCVVNTTKDAREVFKALQEINPEGLFHLSARMCPAHRRKVLAVVRERLAGGQPCRLVSTQLIEAGVDVDFPIVFRAVGPLDSIIQSAGRCNREGRHSKPRPVIVFRPASPHPLPRAYEQVMRITESFLARKSDAQSGIHEPSFYAEYFAELYKLVGRDSPEQDPVFKRSTELDFPGAAEACQLVGDDTRAVLVKWGDGEGLVSRLATARHLTATECREAQRYSVNLYQTEFSSARVSGYIFQPARDWDLWAWNSDYDQHLGLGHIEGEAFIQ